MNQHLYRIIFSHSLGQLIAVAETTRAQGKPGERGPGGGRRQGFSLRALCFATLLGFGGVAFAADIVAATGGDASKHPVVDRAANGVTVVQIATPTSGGVSHNQYQQFNVSPAGVVLNNSAKLVATQQAGYIDGNTKLKAGSARIILNEVIQPNPSSLNGYIEVAGQRAQVVIANPWGISCSGCGFINASKATLTTGVPQMSDGSLTGYLVQSGSVRIDGTGLDATELDSFSIISRALQINAKLYAKKVNAVLGRNHVDAESLQASPLAEDASEKPDFALDVASLGGMYANAIVLKGTEKGVGVNSQGLLMAGIDGLTLSANGDIRLAGKTGADGLLQLNGHRFENNGEIKGQLDVGLNASDFTNKGMLSSGSHLLLDAQGIDNQSGHIAAGKSAKLTATSLKPGHINASTLLDISLSGDYLHDGELYAQDIHLQAKGIENRGVLAADRDLTIEGDSLLNRSKSLLFAGQDQFLKLGSLDNQEDAIILATRHLNIEGAGGQRANIVRNDRGVIQAETGDLSIRAAVLDNLGANPEVEHTAFRESTGGLDGRAIRTICLPGERLRSCSNGWTGWMRGGGFHPVEADAWRSFIDRYPVIRNRPFGPWGGTWSWPGYSSDGEAEEEGLRLTASGYTEKLKTGFVAKAGKLLSGGNMLLEGEAMTNSFGAISAVKNLTLNGGRFSNKGLELKQRTQLEAELVDMSEHEIDGYDVVVDEKTIGSVPSTMIVGGGLQGNLAELVNGAETGRLSTLNNRPDASSGDAGAAVDGLQARVKPDDVVQTSIMNGIKQNGQGQLDLSALEWPSGGLFASKPEVSSNYLIESNPRFADKKQFLSSDYMLQRLNFAPGEMPKRLGDGYYEMRLVMNQVLTRTGQQTLQGFTDQTAQYQALMNAGVTYAQQMHLTPGVALTAAQMQQMTSDMVWLESRTVTLADGGQQTVLVPQLYLASAGRLQLNTDGALIAGQQVELATHQLVNAGALEGKVLIASAQGDLSNLGGVIKADKLTLSANHDLTNRSGTIQGKDLDLSAGRTLLLDTSVRRDHLAGGYTDLVAQGATVAADTSLRLHAGQDLQLNAAQLLSQGSMALSAGNDIKIGSQAYETDFASRSGENSLAFHDTRQLGSQISASGDVSLFATNDLSLTGSALMSEGKATLSASRDVRLDAAQASHSYYKENHGSHKGLFSSSSTTAIYSNDSTTQQGSQVSADTIDVRAGRDLNLQASQVAGTRQVDLVAQRDLNIAAGFDTSKSFQFHEEKTSGMFTSGGLGVTFGNKSAKDTAGDASRFVVGSTVGSIDGNVNLVAGHNASVQGSDLIAGKDLSVAAQNIDIQAATQSNAHQETHERQQAGLTVALSGVVATIASAAMQGAEQIQQSGNGRVAALQGVKAGLTGIQAYQQYQQEMAKPLAEQSYVGVKFSIGSQKSKSSSQSLDTNLVSSELNAGGDIKLQASGSGAKDAAGKASDGDLNLLGSSAKGQNVELSAARDINLSAMLNQSTSSSSNQSAGWNLGIELSLGSKTGISVFANGNAARGKENANSGNYAETNVAAAKTLTFKSGQDANLTGAMVSGSSINADVGRNLTMASLQDYDHYNSQQTSASGGFSFTFGTGAANAYLSLSRQKIKSDYESVVQQTGFYAGTGGFDIKVGEHTQLNGSVLGSHADADKNHLSTGTLGWSNLDNKAEYHVESQTIGFSGGTSLSAAQNSLATAASMSASLLGGNASGSASSTSYAAISPASIEIRNQDQQQQDVTGISRDVEHAANGLSPIFNKQRELDRLQEAQLIGEIGQQAVQIAVTYANLPVQRLKGEAADKDAEAEQAGKDAAQLRAEGRIAEANVRQEAADAASDQAFWLNIQADIQQIDVDKKWGLTSDFQIAARAASAALQGLAGGNMGQAVSGAAAPYLAGVIKDLTYDPVKKETNLTANVMAHALLGAVVAQASGGDAAAGAVGAGSAPLIGRLISKEVYHEDDPSKLTDAQKQTVSALTTLAGSLAGTAVGGNSAAALTGGQAAKNEVENNVLGESLTDRYLYARQSKVLRNLVERANQVGSSKGLKMAAGMLALAGTPAAVKMAITCVSNPVCLNEAAIAIGEMAAGDALPVGLGGTALAKSAEKYFAAEQAGHSAEAKAELSKFSELLISSRADAKAKFPSLSVNGKKYVDIFPPEVRKHILYGDGPGSGGHLWPGQPGKTIFPQSWSADKVMHEVGDIATSPTTRWYAQTGTGGIYTKNGDPAKWVAYEMRSGVQIRVVYQPATGKVITAFPDPNPVPRILKPAK